MKKKVNFQMLNLSSNIKHLLYVLQLEQDYELLTLSVAIKENDIRQKIRSISRLKKIHKEIEALQDTLKNKLINP
ncbi:hypothetical protein NSQ62_08370 [Solibacillus sp. FSL H8-0523]|uniref:hypothetical protein n=1 Tax=Solibacillus sp. FSL H8-0523 TaxID=2954511 RepID=UPI003101917B